ncbi:FadR family transcriptional regulator [Sphingomonas sp. CGMCC 1.13654]|uniref:FadR family transcriptional regulator n=1 Tax=Sphingomonas chungangi TaxID=2683589 RepID=A0A838L1T1_9SPHN|nr:FCD domain-containing protein [Sphingomonas chungangi]MBA2932462.1 FadR family transcriptional regulator [Sphingomonas chungangi]MVW56085.1 FCD domain-containing protein [Sphingomonas chungangi]
MPQGSTAEGPNFTPVKTLRTFEMICEQIRGELAAGTLKAGDKLPAERDLAVQLGVSRNALREALRSLEVAGIIRNAKGAKGGAFVKYADPERVTQAMEDYVSLGDITLDELTEARIAMQDVIVRLACQRASDVDLAELEVIAEKTQKVSDVETRYKYAVEYYTVLARATRNRVFGIFVDALSSILHKFVQGPGYETLQESLIQSRLKLVKHLRARDADAAAQEMRKHLERIHRHVRKNVKARATLSN